MNTLELLKQQLAQKSAPQTADTLKQATGNVVNVTTHNPNFDYETWQRAKEYIKATEELLSRFEGMFQKLESRKPSTNPKGYTITFEHDLYACKWDEIRNEMKYERTAPVGQLYRLRQDNNQITLLFAVVGQGEDFLKLFIKGEKFHKEGAKPYTGSEFAAIGEDGSILRHFWGMNPNIVGWQLVERFDCLKELLTNESGKRFDPGRVLMEANRVLGLWEPRKRGKLDVFAPATIVRIAQRIAQRRDTVKRQYEELLKAEKMYRPTAEQLQAYRAERPNRKPRQVVPTKPLAITETETV